MVGHTIFAQDISMMFFSVSYEHQKVLILEHSATKSSAIPSISLIMDNPRDGSVRTCIKKAEM